MVDQKIREGLDKTVWFRALIFFSFQAMCELILGEYFTIWQLIYFIPKGDDELLRSQIIDSLWECAFGLKIRDVRFMYESYSTITKGISLDDGCGVTAFVKPMAI